MEFEQLDRVFRTRFQAFFAGMALATAAVLCTLALIGFLRVMERATTDGTLPCSEGGMFTQHFDDGASYTMTASGVQRSSSGPCTITTYHVRVAPPQGWELVSVERIAEPVAEGRPNPLRRAWRVLLRRPTGGLDALAVQPWHTLAERGMELTCSTCVSPTLEVLNASTGAPALP